VESLSFVFAFFRYLRVRAAMAFKAVVAFFLLTRLVHCTSPNDLGSDVTILINNDLLGKLTSAQYWFSLTFFVNRPRKPLRRFRGHPPLIPIWSCCSQRMCDIGRAIVVARVEHFKHTAESRLPHISGEICC